MKKLNKVFIATSLDGFIADKEGNIDWLHSIPNPDKIDMGYNDFISKVDAIIMGRNTFETVLGFGIDWPYKIPVFVLSNTLKSLPEKLKNENVELISGPLKEVLVFVNNKNLNRLYIDGGKTIQNFLEEDLIHEMTITIIPILLGEGIHLFSKNTKNRIFECKESKIYLDQIVQNKFIRKSKLKN